MSLLVDITLSPPRLCFCVSVFTWQSPDSSSAPGATSRLFSHPFMCLQLSGAGSGASKHTARAKAAPSDSSAPLLSRHYSWPLTFSQEDYCGFELAVSLFLCVCVCVSVRACACGRGMTCTGVIVSGQWKSSMRTSTPHKAISLSTPAARSVCVYICVCLWVCVCVSPSLHGL